MKATVRGLDVLLSRFLRIHDLSPDPDCILRLAISRSRRELALADGTHVRRGDLIGDLHLCSRRIPPMPPGGPDLPWGVVFYRRLRKSLQLLAGACSAERVAVPVTAAAEGRGKGDLAGRLFNIQGFRAVGFLMSDDSHSLHAAVPAIAQRLGLEITEVEDPASAGPGRRFAAFWEHGFSLLLVWAYNAPSLQSRELGGLRRVTLWISRRELTRRHGRDRGGREGCGHPEPDRVIRT